MRFSTSILGFGALALAAFQGATAYSTDSYSLARRAAFEDDFGLYARDAETYDDE